MRRVVLNRRNLFVAVLVILIIIGIASIVWTVVDPPLKQAEYTVTEDTTDDGDTIVLVQYSCQSNSMIFDYLNLGWTSMLLLIATILAFQARSLRQDFNESQTLGTCRLWFFTLLCKSSYWGDPLTSFRRHFVQVS